MKPNYRLPVCVTQAGWIALAVFALLTLASVYFYDILSGSYLLTERDLGVFFIPPRYLWVELAKNGMFPLWNPYHLNGHPLLATLQPCVLYPLSIIYFLLPFDLAFNYTIVFHFFLAGLFTFLLLRGLNASHSASLISAITFMLSGYLLSVHTLLTHLLSVAWTPLVLLLFLLGLRKGSIKFIVFSGVAACVMLLGGGVEIVYGTLVMVCLLTLFWNVGARHAVPLPSWKQRLCYLGVFIAIFLGLSAVQLLPFMELSALSTRAGGISYNEATTWSMHPKDLLQFLMPDLYGYKLHSEKYWLEQNWLKTIYLGTIPFLLTIFFFIKRDKRVLCVFLLMIVGSLILAFGGHTPIYLYIYQYVPFFNKIRYPVKFLFLTTIVISVTAGLGYDRLMSNKQRATGNGPRAMSNEQRTTGNGQRAMSYSMLILSFLTAVAFGYLNFFESGISSFLKSKGFDTPNYNDLSLNLHNMKRLLCITTIFGLAVFVGLKRKALKKFLPAAILVLLAFDLFFAGQGFYHKTLSETYHGKSSNMDFVQSDKSLFRVFTTPKTLKDDTVVIALHQSKGMDYFNIKLEKVSPGFNIERHVFDIYGSEVMILKRVKDLYSLITTAPKADSTNLLNLMNVKYVISMPQIDSDELKMVKMNIPATAEQLDELEEVNTIKIYQNLNCLPRAFLVKDYKVVPSEEEYKKMMQSKEFDPAKLLLLDETPHKIDTSDIQNNSEESSGHEKIIEKVEIVQYNSNSMHLQVNLPEPKFLFMSESYYPGWKAYVDGKEAHIYRANYAFRALFLKPGEHNIELIYDPWTFKAGLIISIITIIGVTALLIRPK